MSSLRAVEAHPVETERDLLVSKLEPPPAHGPVVARTGLVNRLRACKQAPIVTIVAPAGYGKTTLLREWAERDRRPFAWVSLEESEDDQGALLAYLAAALARIQPNPFSVLDAKKRSIGPAKRSLPWLASRLASVREPLVVVLDNADRLHDRTCLDALATLLDHIPDGSVVALAGRAAPRLPLARLRVEGRVLELGPNELRLSEREAEALLRAEGMTASASRTSALVDFSEGWAAGLELAARSFEANGRNGDWALSFSGADRFVSDYVRLEVLSTLTPQEVRFVTRTSLLDRMSGPLCDAVLEETGSGRVLESLDRASRFVVPLDHQRKWYRYHHLFRDALRAELEQREPELKPKLNRRAARWCEANGLPEAAIAHAHAAGDTKRVAALVGATALPAYDRGRASTVSAWFDWFENGSIGRYPGLSVLRAWIDGITGKPSSPLRLDHEQPLRPTTSDADPGENVDPGTLVLRAARCREGPDQMLEDARAALEEMPTWSQWRPAALLVLGVSHLLAADREADTVLAQAADAADQGNGRGPTAIGSIALAELCLLAMGRGEWRDAASLACEARARAVGLEEYAPVSIVYAASARTALRRGDSANARADLERAGSLRPPLTYTLPWLAVQTRLELTRACLAVADSTSAHDLMAEIDELLRRHPEVGLLRDEADGLREEARALHAPEGSWARSLTAAELRLIPFLATHLTFREIAERLFVSRNTVKTQAISVYRKLGVSSRSEAIERSASLGIVDPSVVPESPFALSSE